MDLENINNLTILYNIIEKNWGYRKSDLALLKKRIFNPFIPEEFKNYKFDENFRAHFPISLNEFSNLFKDYDIGWDNFNRYFHKATWNRKIHYDDYLKNKIKVGKNTFKIKKYVQNIYLNNNKLFIEDFKKNYKAVFAKKTNDKLAYYEEIVNNNDFSDIENLIETYIVHVLEKIGEEKPSYKENVELVISFNYADWFLCSTKEKWSSCLSLENGDYWAGIPTTFLDNNRAFIYITNREKKEFLGIKTDKFISRVWCFIDNKSRKLLSKNYPVNFLNEKTIQNITNDNTYISFVNVMYDCYNKYEITPLLFDKSEVYCSIFNDAVYFDEEYFSKTKKLKYFFNSRQGMQTFSFKDFSKLPNPFFEKSLVKNYIEKNIMVKDEIICFKYNKYISFYDRKKTSKEKNLYPDCCLRITVKRIKNIHVNHIDLNFPVLSDRIYL